MQGEYSTGVVSCGELRSGCDVRCGSEYGAVAAVYRHCRYNVNVGFNSTIAGVQASMYVLNEEHVAVLRRRL